MEIHNMAGHLIRRLNQISTSVFQAHLKEAGFDMTPVQFAAMNALHNHPKIDQASVAGLIAHDRATIGGVVDRLEAKGLVERQVNAKDRRAKILQLTEKGEAVLAELTPIIRNFQAEILTGLDEDEREQFIALARKAAQGGNSLSRAPIKSGVKS